MKVSRSSQLITHNVRNDNILVKKIDKFDNF